MLPALKDELNNLREFDSFLTVSEREASLLTKSLGKPVAVAGHAFMQPANHKITTYDQRKGLLFMGAMNHPGLPNIDSLNWLADEILPVLKRLGEINPNEAMLTITGPYRADLVDPLIKKMNSVWPVHHRGQVDNIDALLQEQRLLLAPTRYAAGLPHKVQHSISSGLPVVTTQLICEQMDWEAGDGLLCSNDPREIAHHINNLYNSSDLWQDVQIAGLMRIAKECEPEKLKQALQETFL